ncbi:MAG: FAD-dependent oxidoreductase [Gemmatimonadaceae bacterium]
MATEQEALTGPDFTGGVPLSSVPDGGSLGGNAHGQPVLLARFGDEVFAVGGKCTHYGGPLAEGLVVAHTVRCPWHHACFDLRTGEALGAPALHPLPRWTVERRGLEVFVTAEAVGATAPPRSRAARAGSIPERIVIVGAGAAADAAADALRREGYGGAITMFGSDPSPPYDRPNLSKDFLAGNAPEEWIPLRPASYHEDNGIRLVLGRTVTAIDRGGRRVVLDDGTNESYGALLLATGASPVPLPAAVSHPRVHYLRTLADSRAIIAAAGDARVAVVIGASFIGLEVAAALRARGIDVHVVAPEPHPLERVLGRALGDFVRALHESHGVAFHLGRGVATVAADSVTLDDGERIVADLVVAGIGVRPNEALAAQASLDVGNGILVNAYLQTSAPGIFAAGDVARYPDHRTGERIRVEHWVAAQRQGQAAARNLLGAGEPFETPPFFWSQHYDVAIAYVGHAVLWDAVDVEGRLADRDCAITYRSNGRTLAVATVGRDRASLEAELALERQRNITTSEE